jgi:hypothetical protein
MHYFFSVFILLMPTLALAQDTHMEKARRVLQSVPLVDGHNDLPWYIRSDFKQAPLDVEAYDLRRPTSGNTDLARLQRGMVGNSGPCMSPVITGTQGSREFNSSRSTSRVE